VHARPGKTTHNRARRPELYADKPSSCQSQNAVHKSIVVVGRLVQGLQAYVYDTQIFGRCHVEHLETRVCLCATLRG